MTHSEKAMDAEGEMYYVLEDRMLSSEEFEATSAEFRAAYWKCAYMMMQRDRFRERAESLSDPDGYNARFIERCEQALADAKRELAVSERAR